MLATSTGLAIDLLLTPTAVARPQYKLNLSPGICPLFFLLRLSHSLTLPLVGFAARHRALPSMLCRVKRNDDGLVIGRHLSSHADIERKVGLPIFPRFFAIP